MIRASEIGKSYYSTSVVIYITVVISTIVGCATPSAPYWKKTAYGTWSFSQEELSRLSTMSKQHILSSAIENDDQRVQIFVKSKELDGKSKLKGLAGHDSLYVLDAHGQEVKIPLDQITEIQSYREIKVTPQKKSTSMTAEEFGEVALYAPLVPVAIVSWPFLRAIGLDAGKNDKDKEKAQLAYGGMTKDDLVGNIGEPIDKYHCESKNGQNEVWVYQDNKVLRGGKAMFINLEDGKVYHTSQNTTFFKETCSPIEHEQQR